MATAEADSSSLSSKPQETGTLLEILKKIKDSGVENEEVPQKYVLKKEDRPTIADDEATAFGEIPVIDLSDKDIDRDELAGRLRDAATEWGFFQLTNHGLSLEAMREVESQLCQFFELPAELKQRLGSADGGPRLYVGDSTTDKPSSLHWAESLFLVTDEEKLDKTIRKVWPDGNAEFRGAITKFITSVKIMYKQLLELIAESLGLKADRYSQLLNFLAMRCHFYPACPRPSDTLGCKGHTDGTCLTILLQDQVGGLQILKGGQWIGIKPVEGALVVNVGDQLHAMTNGRFKSVMHRVVVNKNVQRLSVAAFFNIDRNVEISAPEELIDEAHPRRYNPFTFTDYLKHILSIRTENEDISRNGVEILQSFRAISLEG